MHHLFYMYNLLISAFLITEKSVILGKIAQFYVWEMAYAEKHWCN